uniref:Uncharacterized protein n=1 Tax=Meloidogyne hapla TaxID=6305 RepID=A0A1I8BH18_MELHA
MGLNELIEEDKNNKLNEEENLEENLDLQRKGTSEGKVKEELHNKKNNEEEDEKEIVEEKMNLNGMDDEEEEGNVQKKVNGNLRMKEINKVNEGNEKEKNMEEKFEINKMDEEEEGNAMENRDEKFKENEVNNGNENNKMNNELNLMNFNMNKGQNQQIGKDNKIEKERLDVNEEDLENLERMNRRNGRMRESYVSDESLPDDEVVDNKLKKLDDVKEREEIEKLKEIEKETKKENKIGIEKKEREIFISDGEFNDKYKKQQNDKKQFFGFKENEENNIQRQLMDIIIMNFLNWGLKKNFSGVHYKGKQNRNKPQIEWKRLNNDPLTFGFNQQNPLPNDKTFLDFGFYQENEFIKQPYLKENFPFNNYLNDFGYGMEKENIFGMNNNYDNLYQSKQYSQQKWEDLKINDYIPNFDFGGSKYYGYNKYVDNKFYFDPMEKDKKKR